MLIHEYHPEDIKSAIRKRYRSLRAFELAHELPKQAVSEILRGRTSQRVERAIRRVMVEEKKYGDARAIKTASNTEMAASHRLSGEAA